MHRTDVEPDVDLQGGDPYSVRPAEIPRLSQSSNTRCPRLVAKEGIASSMYGQVHLSTPRSMARERPRTRPGSDAGGHPVTDGWIAAMSGMPHCCLHSYSRRHVCLRSVRQSGWVGLASSFLYVGLLIQLADVGLLRVKNLILRVVPAPSRASRRPSPKVEMARTVATIITEGAMTAVGSV